MPDDSNNSKTRVDAMAPDASTSPVDWSRPIEAVHEDGRVVSCSFVEDDGGRFIPMRVHGVPIDGPDNHYAEGFFDKYGTRPHSKWRIRNVQPTTSELDPALWDRMVALVRRMASGMEGSTIFPSLSSMGDYIEARAIVADLPKPVDPDLIEARKLAASFSNRDDVSHADYLSGDLDSGDEVQNLLAAIKRGRELAGEQA